MSIALQTVVTQFHNVSMQSKTLRFLRAEVGVLDAQIRSLCVHMAFNVLFTFHFISFQQQV